MTAVVIMNVIGATLIVATILSLLAWAILSERRTGQVGIVRPARARRVAGGTSRRQASRPVLDLS